MVWRFGRIAASAMNASNQEHRFDTDQTAWLFEARCTERQALASVEGARPSASTVFRADRADYCVGHEPRIGLAAKVRRVE
jgi:hypothetical protein